MKTQLRTAVQISLISFACLLFGCGGTGSKGGGGGSDVAAPSALSYTSPVQATVGTMIAPLSPKVTGTVSSYSVSSALPAGLSLNTISGVISGTPTAIAAQAAYSITATNVSGSTAFNLSLTVNPAAPSALSYASPIQTTVGTAITPLSPTVTGTVSSYSVSPALPAGLSLNTTSGVISGTPTASAAQAAYSITATNVSGGTAFSLSLTVNPAAPSALSYASPVLATVGAAITPLSPTVTGTVSSYSVSPALPAGLSLNTASGVISGAPTVSATQAAYSIAATNASGSVTFSLSITVGPPQPPLIAVSAISLTFANQLVSTTSAAQTIAVINTGAAPLSVGGTTISGPAASSFAYSSTCSSISANGTCMISVTFTPSDKGSLSANLSIASNTSDSPTTIALSGFGDLMSISFDDPIIPSGGTATLTWSAPNATSCTASGSWSGPEATNGTQSVTPTAPGFYTYTLTCTGTSSGSPSSQSVVLTAYGPTPSVKEPTNESGHQAEFYVAPPNQLVGLQMSLVVPPFPPVPSESGAAVFLWPGIDPATNSVNYLPIGDGVLQPVLSWGPSCAPTSQPTPYSSWWISSQYVNVFGSDPGYAGCFSGSAMSVNPGDVLLINMSQDAASGVWTQTVTDSNTIQSVLLSTYLQGQGQNWAYFAMETWYDATIGTPVTFSNATVTFQSPDTAEWCSNAQGADNAYIMTPPTPQNSGTQCFISTIVLTAP